MERKFMEAEKGKGENPWQVLPVVVRDKSMLPEWYEYYPDWNNDHAKETYHHKNKKITLINSFLTKHKYKYCCPVNIFVEKSKV